MHAPIGFQVVFFKKMIKLINSLIHYIQIESII